MPDLKYSQLPLISAVTEAQEWGCNDAGASRLIRVQDLTGYYFKRISGDNGAAGPYKTLQVLTSDSADVTTTTPTTVMTTTEVGTGTWHYCYTVAYQSANIFNGISFVVAHTGTVGRYTKSWIHVTTGSLATNGTGDDVAGDRDGQMMEGHATNVNAQDEGATSGVAVRDADILARVEGVLVVTASGNLELRIRTGNSGTAVRLMAGSLLELTKIA